MRKSLLIQVYLNMAAAYMQLNHFSLAEEVMSDAAKLTGKVSQIYLRQAQSLTQRKGSTIEQLKEGKRLVSMAIAMRPEEKIFTTANANILKMLNLHDAAEVYQECLEKIEEKLISRGKEML